MKIKHAFIGNSSSASYYIRRGNFTEVDKLGAGGVVLDCWDKWHPNNRWRQTARIDATFVGSVGSITGMSFKYGAYVVNNADTASRMGVSFTPAPTGGTRVLDKALTPVTQNLTGQLGSSRTEVIAEYRSGFAVGNRTTQREQLLSAVLPTNSWILYYDWQFNTQIMSIRFMHNTPTVVISSTAIILKDFTFNVA